MHCILNGFDYGPFSILKMESSSEENDEIFLPVKKRQRTCLIPDQSIDEHTKFWAFIDVYGATKRVRILQLYGRKSFLLFFVVNNLFFFFLSILSSKYIEKSLSFSNTLSSQII